MNTTFSSTGFRGTRNAFAGNSGSAYPTARPRSTRISSGMPSWARTVSGYSAMEPCTHVARPRAVKASCDKVLGAVQQSALDEV